MLDVSDIINDPDFAQSFTIIRSTGAFVAGGFEKTATNVQGYGVVTVAKDEDLEMLPEADRVTGAMAFYSTDPIYTTQLDGGLGAQNFGTGGFGTAQQHISDVIVWRGQQYRIMSVRPWTDYGFIKAIGVRTSGN